MSTFFLYVLTLLFILVTGGLVYKNFFQRQSNELKEQIDIYYMRERYMNDILNIDQLTLKELTSLQKNGDKISEISHRHQLTNNTLFSQLNLKNTQKIIESAIKKKNWIKTSEEELAKNNTGLAYRQKMQIISDLLQQMPPSMKGSHLHNDLKKKSLEVITSCALPSVPEGLFKPSALPENQAQNQTPDTQYEDAEALVNINFMNKALMSGEPVARIMTRTDRCATGFMIAPQLFLTAYNVLPNPAEAKNATVSLSFQNDDNDNIETIKVLNLNPKKLFINDEKLNYALVGVENEDNVMDIITAKLTLEPVLVTEKIAIIHHPENRQKHISFYHTNLAGFAGDFIHYTATTKDGSIGSPVFNENWQVIAMHLSRNDSDGNAQTARLKQGVKIISILKDLQQKMIRLPRKQQEYLQKHLPDMTG